MITTALNPAAGLTANKVPYAIAGGRLANSGITFDPTANGDITFAPNGTGIVNQQFSTRKLVASELNAGNIYLHILPTATAISSVNYILASSSGNLLLNAPDVNQPVDVRIAGALFGRFAATTGRFLIGGLTADNANGAVQLVSHSALAGGYGFGSVADGTETMWRHSAGVLRTGGRVRADLALQVNGVDRINTTQPVWTNSGVVSRNTTLGSTLGDAINYINTLLSDLKAIGILG